MGSIYHVSCVSVSNADDQLPFEASMFPGNVKLDSWSWNSFAQYAHCDEIPPQRLGYAVFSPSVHVNELVLPLGAN
nr:hypothetical protein CFP56_32974 [Quercus suber]